MCMLDELMHSKCAHDTTTKKGTKVTKKYRCHVLNKH